MTFLLMRNSDFRSGPNEIVMVSNQAILAPSVNQSTAAQQQTRKTIFFDMSVTFGHRWVHQN